MLIGGDVDVRQKENVERLRTVEILWLSREICKWRVPVVRKGARAIVMKTADFKN